MIGSMSTESNARQHIQSFRWWQGNPDIEPSLAELRDLAALRDVLDEVIITKAVEAHDYEDHSWTEVGDALGISRQAAQKRFRAATRLL